MDAETKLKKAHVRLMRHPETCLYSGVILLGDTKVVDGNDVAIPTAWTDGLNTSYNRDFINTLSVEELSAVALHETLHKLLKHCTAYRDLDAKDKQLSDASADFVVNDIIVNLKDPTLCKLPDGALYDPMFHDWSMRQVFDYLWKEKQGEQGKNPDDRQGNQRNNGGGAPAPSNTSKRGQSMDKHDRDGKDGKDGKGGSELTPEQQQELGRKINEALQQGGLLAGRMGATIPRSIKEAMEPEIRWEDVLDDFWSSTMRGKDEYTYAKPNRRRLADDLYLPSTYSETVGEIIVGIDTSGSIGQADINRVGGRVSALCELYPPERIRVLWWDTRVHAEQTFEPSQYGDIVSLLKPVGGGGTRVGCVSEYIKTHVTHVDGVIVFTDGHVESQFNWDINAPTLWLVTQNKQFSPPAGITVMVKP